MLNHEGFLVSITSIWYLIHIIYIKPKHCLTVLVIRNGRDLGLNFVKVLVLSDKIQQNIRAMLNMVVVYMLGDETPTISHNLPQRAKHEDAMAQMLSPLPPNLKFVIQDIGPLSFRSRYLLVWIRVKFPGLFRIHLDKVLVGVVRAIGREPRECALIK